MKKDIIYLLLLSVTAGIIISLYQEQEQMKNELTLLSSNTLVEECAPCPECSPCTPKREALHETASSLSQHGTNTKGEESQTQKQYRDYLLSMKLNAIEQFVPLDEDQTERLRDKFSLELTPGVKGEQLEAILGKEQTAFLREQREIAFERGKVEALEREVFFWSRKLNLSPTQESFFLNALDDTEQEIIKWRSEQKAQSLQARTLLFFEETKRRRKLLREKLGDVLSEEQLDSYVEQESQSAAAEVELWHSPE